MEDQDIDVRGILNLLRRRLGLIVATFVVCLGLAGIAIFALTPMFTASALVLVDGYGGFGQCPGGFRSRNPAFGRGAS
jgi:uncharacterized protein involved in exopolysaccharide biosynthesis